MYLLLAGGGRGGAPKRDVVIYEWFPSTDNIEMTGDSRGAMHCSVVHRLTERPSPLSFSVFCLMRVGIQMNVH